MEVTRALADLVEISPQIEAAVVCAGGEALGSVGVSEAAAAALAQSGRKLLETADEGASEGARVTQLHATLRDGEVFVVGGTAPRAVVAVTSGRPAPGLVFYDLKRCLADLAEPDPEPDAPTSRRRRWGRKERGDAA